MEDYPLLGVFWTALMFMFVFMWVWVVIGVFADNFRRTDHSGWAKALWTLFIIFVPLIGVVTYMIARPKLTEEELMRAAGARPMGGSNVSAASEINTAHQLLETGAIDQAEYSKLKQRALG